MKRTTILIAIFTMVLAAESARAQSDADLAKKLNNPLAAMISVPFQLNYDEYRSGEKYVLNIQPVAPVELSPNWNLISRTIMPLVAQDDVVPGSSQNGLGDILQSFFFVPVSSGKTTWGVGPVALLPSGSEPELSARKWGLGPTAIILKQEGGWTFGALANHIWSVAGHKDRADVSSTFVQPFLAHTTKNAWTFTLNTESTYDWDHEQWSVPVIAVVSKLVRFGDQRASIGGGLRYWAESPDGGPQDLGVRVVVTFLFPKSM